MFLSRSIKNFYTDLMARPRKFDEATALRGARAAFRRTGYAGTSLSDLTEATGLGKGSLYNAFGDKRQLFERVLGDYCDEVDALTDQRVGEDAGLDAALGYVRTMVDDTIADQESVGCMIAKVTSELAHSEPVFVERASQTLHHAEDAITEALTRAQASGEWNSHEDPREVSQLMIAISRGIDALGKAGYSAEALRAIEQTAARLITR